MALFHEEEGEPISQELSQSIKEALHIAEVKSNRYLSRIIVALAVLLLFCWGCNVIGIFNLNAYLMNILAWSIFLVYVMLYALSMLLDWDHEALKYFLIGGICLSAVFAGILYQPLLFFILVPGLVCISYCDKKLAFSTAVLMLGTIPINDYVYAVTSYRSSEYDIFYAYFKEPVTLIQEGWYTRNLQEVITENEVVTTYFQYHTLPMVLFLGLCYAICIIASSENYKTIVLQCRTNMEKAEAELEAANKEKELANSNNRIMLSQIQPHFLFNVLNSIYYLCDENPERAQEAISDFADYLRTNVDVLKNNELIPFEREIKHIETYLRLEKMRFGQRLNVVEDIQTTAFFVPELGIQPVVENAVKHGICQKEQGGTLILRTREEEKEFVIIVEDDGVGFDPDNVQTVTEDGRSHVGLSNIQSRIELMSHGTVTIESAIHAGTKVTIVIPKEEIRIEDSGN